MLRNTYHSHLPILYIQNLTRVLEHWKDEAIKRGESDMVREEIAGDL
jgi:hypothetical protein